MSRNLLKNVEQSGERLLNHIYEQNHQKSQNIQNLKFGLFLLVLSIFQNRKTLNVE
jgi:hypothetical protein